MEHKFPCWRPINANQTALGWAVLACLVCLVPTLESTAPSKPADRPCAVPGSLQVTLPASYWLARASAGLEMEGRRQSLDLWLDGPQSVG